MLRSFAESLKICNVKCLVSILQYFSPHNRSQETHIRMPKMLSSEYPPLLSLSMKDFRQTSAISLNTRMEMNRNLPNKSSMP